MVLYPIFVQMYLELVYNNHEKQGNNNLKIGIFILESRKSWRNVPSVQQNIDNKHFFLKNNLNQLNIYILLNSMFTLCGIASTLSVALMQCVNFHLHLDKALISA